MNLVNMFEDAGDVAVFEIDNERAYEQVMDKFGHIIEWSGDYMVAPRNVFTQIEQVAHDAGGAANEITDDMFEATGLTFMGSPCTKDCSGHKAGYEWSEKRGGQNANSHSQSFNNGAAISVNAKNKQQQPAQQTKPQTAADKLRAKMADLLGPDKAKTFGLAEGTDMCKVCGQTPCNCTSISEGSKKELPQWKKDWYAKQKPNSWPKHPQPYHNPDWISQLSPEERKKLTGGKDVAEGKFNELSVMLADYHNSNITDVKFYGMYGKTRQQVAKEYANYLEEAISRRGFLKGAGAAAAAGAASKASAIAGAFPTPSHQAAMYKAAADSNAAQARADAAAKAKADAERLRQGTSDVERLNKVNYHGKNSPKPTNAEWDGDSDFLYLDGTQYAKASRMPITGDVPSDLTLVSTREGRQVYLWTRRSLKGVKGHYFYPAEKPNTVGEGIFDRFKKKPAQPEVADPGNYPRIGSDIAQWMADTVEYHKSKFPDSVWKLFCPTYPDYLPVRVRVGTSEKIMHQHLDDYINLRNQNPEAVRIARQKFDKNNTYPSGPRDDYTNKVLDEAGFDKEEFRRHMEQLRAREELRKTDPVSAKALGLRDALPQQTKKKPEDDSIGINDPRHPGYAYTQAGRHDVTESRLYYSVVGTVDSKLRSEFGLRKDANGWYLKESATPKVKFQAYKAFGSPKLKEYDLSVARGSTGVITGADNPVSPVGSVPRGQQKTRR